MNTKEYDHVVQKGKHLQSCPFTGARYEDPNSKAMALVL